MTEDEMVGWHQQLYGNEFEQALAVGVGQGSLVCYSPWGRKESDTTERLLLSYREEQPKKKKDFCIYCFSNKNNSNLEPAY